MNPLPASLFAIALASIGDPDGTRTITAIVALLVVLGVALAMLAVWLFRTTRPDPELLAPLDVMGERKWRRADPVWQRRRLDEVRPADARPLTPSVAPPEFDEAFDRGPTASGFDDLHDDHSAEHGHVDAAVGDDDESGNVDDVDDVGETADRDAERAADLGVDLEHANADGEPAPIAISDDGDRVVDRDSESGEVGGPVTPSGIVRPTFDELPDHDLDPELLEQAMRDLDAELAARRQYHEDDDRG